MSFTSDLENSKQTNRLLIRILIGMFILLVLMVIGWSSVQNQMTVHYPPDLRSGAVMKKDQIDPSEVYLFAQYILQQLNNWDSNGAEDYPKNVNKLRYYLTPKYQQQLKSDIERRLAQGELRRRLRSFQPIAGNAYSEDKVEILGANTWLVWLDIKIIETVLGQKVKNLSLRYPIKVTRYDANRELNPWSLALDGSGGNDAQRILTTAEVKR